MIKEVNASITHFHGIPVEKFVDTVILKSQIKSNHPMYIIFASLISLIIYAFIYSLVAFLNQPFAWVIFGLSLAVWPVQWAFWLGVNWREESGDLEKNLKG